MQLCHKRIIQNYVEPVRCTYPELNLASVFLVWGGQKSLKIIVNLRILQIFIAKSSHTLPCLPLWKSFKVFGVLGPSLFWKFYLIQTKYCVYLIRALLKYWRMNDGGALKKGISPAGKYLLSLLPPSLIVTVPVLQERVPPEHSQTLSKHISPPQNLLWHIWFILRLLGFC